MISVSVLYISLIFFMNCRYLFPENEVKSRLICAQFLFITCGIYWNVFSERGLVGSWHRRDLLTLDTYWNVHSVHCSTNVKEWTDKPDEQSEERDDQFNSQPRKYSPPCSHFIFWSLMIHFSQMLVVILSDGTTEVLVTPTWFKWIGINKSIHYVSLVYWLGDKTLKNVVETWRLHI